MYFSLKNTRNAAELLKKTEKRNPDLRDVVWGYWPQRFEGKEFQPGNLEAG